MPCSTPATATVQVSAFVPPPATPTRAPYVSMQYFFPQNPSQFGYQLGGAVWCQQISGATSYNVQCVVNGKVIWSDTIQQADIPYQYQQVPGYFLAPFNAVCNSGICNYPGLVNIGPTDTLVFTYQACNANGQCSGSSPATQVTNIGPGNYGPSV